MTGTTSNFLYDQVNLAQELTSGGTPTANLLSGLGIDEVFTRTDPTGTSTLLIDAVGSALELADTAGTLQTHYTYEPFGATTVSGATSTNAAQFTGRENDATGLYALRARYFNPILQRFISEDPLGFAGGRNAFAYARNAPTRFIDPLGLKPSPRFGQPPRSGPPATGPGGNAPSPVSGPQPDPGPRPDPRPDPEPDPKPNPDPRRKGSCTPYLDRVWEDFKLTNKLPGALTPVGLNMGLRTAETVGEFLETPTIGQLISSGITLDGAILAAYTHGGAFLLSGAAFEIGVGIGSAARAAFECQ